MPTRLTFYRVSVTIFAEVFGVSAVANDQQASPQLAKIRKKNDNLLKTKIMLKPKYKLSCGSFFTFTLAREGKLAPHPPSVTPLQQTL